MRPNSVRKIGCLAATLLLAGAALAADPADDMELFFRDTDIGAMAPQPLATYTEVEPGDAKKLPRAFPDAPPQIPHVVDDTAGPTARENDCLDCHHPDNAKGKKDVPIPASHFQRPVMVESTGTDPMVTQVKGYEKADDVVGLRNNCLLCHVAQATNVTDIGSTFLRLEKSKK